MRVIATFPRLRVILIHLLRAYVIFLWFCAAISIMLVAINTLWGSSVRAVIYLTSWAFFTTSAMMYSELRRDLVKMRFTMYWRFFRRYSPPLGGYAVLHILTGLIFVTADILKGNYWPLALMLILKGVFEHALHDIVDELKAASVLYSEILTGELDRVSIKDPYK